MEDFLKSFLPVHVLPSPWYPLIQVQEKLPTVLAHVASESQLSTPVAHSSKSIR